MPIEIESGQICFRFHNLEGCLAYSYFINFHTPNILNKFLMLEKRRDPNDSPEDLSELQNIHKIIQELSISGTEAEKVAGQYWLAALFSLYFEMYHLNHEGSPCRRAWVHLLKLRYHSLLTLSVLSRQAQGEKDASWLSESTVSQLLPEALRAWRTFCQDPKNHFLFRPQYGLKPLEEEVLSIIYGENNKWKSPLLFSLLNDAQESKVIRHRFISEWILSNRYDWLRAFYLCCQYWKMGSQAGFAILGVLLASAGVLLVADSFFAFQQFLLSIIVVTGIISFRSESFIELLVPRLWAAIAVGYVPLLVTGSVWEAALKIPWCNIATFWGLSFVVSLLYLRWEIGSRLRQTPDLKFSVLIGRSFVLLMIGIFIAFVLGLFILDFVGGPLSAIYLKDCEQLCRAWSVKGLFSPIYPKLLFTFVPIALLLGVVLQIFWQERAVTEPV